MESKTGFTPFFKTVCTLQPKQSCRHFADAIFKCIFLNENVRISLKVSLKFVPKVPNNNIPSLVQIMAWRRSGGKPIPEPIMVYLRKYASLGLNELNWVEDSMTQLLNR